MFFGEVAIKEASGGLLAHGAGNLHKGHVLSHEDCVNLQENGLERVMVVRFEAGDVDENTAATRLTQGLSSSLSTSKANTGRVNIFAAKTGLFYVDAKAIDAFNTVDESLTLACLPPFSRVEKGEMVATLKIIPYAVEEKNLLAAKACLRENTLEIRAFSRQNILLVQTKNPKTSDKILAKTLAVTQNRVHQMGGEIVAHLTCAHSTLALQKTLNTLPAHDILIIFGASAISDRRDVLPMSIDTVFHLGMPVDPGNLLMLGEHQGKPVLGAPGCARSPKENGFDFMLARLMAGENAAEIKPAKLGVGGLLSEIRSRPAPRLGV